MDSFDPTAPNENPEKEPQSKWKNNLNLALKFLLVIVVFILNLYMSCTKIISVIIVPFVWWTTFKQLRKDSRLEFVEHGR